MKRQRCVIIVPISVNILEDKCDCRNSRIVKLVQKRCPKCRERYKDNSMEEVEREF